jgi:hypothetical protein
VTAPALAGVSYARVYAGMWIVDCVCRSALRVEPGAPSWRCWDCGTWADIAWPRNIDDIDYLLSMRPNPMTRNWSPNETVADLLTENVVHGIDPPVVPGLAANVTFAIRGDHIEKLALAPAPTRVAIER